MLIAIPFIQLMFSEDHCDGGYAQLGRAKPNIPHMFSEDHCDGGYAQLGCAKPNIACATQNHVQHTSVWGTR